MASGLAEPDGPAEEKLTGGLVEALEQDEEEEEEEEAEPAEALGEESEMEPDAAEERPPAAGVARLARKVEARAAAKQDDTVGPGDAGKAVRGIQRRLRSLGWYRGSLDGEVRADDAVRGCGVSRLAAGWRRMVSRGRRLVGRWRGRSRSRRRSRVCRG